MSLVQQSSPPVHRSWVFHAGCALAAGGLVLRAILRHIEPRWPHLMPLPESVLIGLEVAVGLVTCLGLALVAFALLDRRARRQHSRVRQVARVALLVVAVAGLWALWDYLPGTIHRDASGFPHGTGWLHSAYRGGRPLADEWYFNGIPKQTTWYRPDGSTVATTDWDDETGGDFYFLDAAGTVSQVTHCVYSPSNHSFVPDRAPQRRWRHGAVPARASR